MNATIYFEQIAECLEEHNYNEELPEKEKPPDLIGSHFLYSIESDFKPASKNNQTIYI